MNVSLSDISSHRALERAIPDKNTAIEFLQYHRLLHNPRLCDHGHQMTLSLSDKNYRWRCRRTKCSSEMA